MCYQDPLNFPFQLLYPCHYEVKNLLPNSRYIFRLRVLTEGERICTIPPQRNLHSSINPLTQIADKLPASQYSDPGTSSTLVVTPQILAPSSPITPHLSIATDTTLSVIVKAAPSDLRKFSPHPRITSFEVQAATSIDPNIWTTFETSARVSVTSKEDNPGISSATLSDLTPNSSHRFRVKAVNSVGPSTWSNPSKYYRTLSGVPGAPSAPSLSGSTSSSVTIDWAPPANDYGAAITEYEIQHRRYSKLNGNEDKWYTSVAKVDPVMVPETKEVQTFTTKVDGGSGVTSGSFWLSFNGEVSSPLAFDATQEDVKNKLEESISAISSVTVRRFSPNNVYSTSDVNGCYTWIVEFR